MAYDERPARVGYDSDLERPSTPGDSYPFSDEELTLREVLEPLGKGPERKSDFSVTSDENDGTPAQHNDTFDLI